MMYARKRMTTIMLPISNILFRSTATSLNPNRKFCTRQQHPSGKIRATSLSHNHTQHNHPTPSLCSRPQPARRPVKGERSSPRARARGSLDGPPQVPVTLALKEPKQYAVGEEPTGRKACASLGRRLRQSSRRDVRPHQRHGPARRHHRHARARHGHQHAGGTCMLPGALVPHRRSSASSVSCSAFAIASLSAAGVLHFVIGPVLQLPSEPSGRREPDRAGDAAQLRRHARLGRGHSPRAVHDAAGRWRHPHGRRLSRHAAGLATFCCKQAA